MAQNIKQFKRKFLSNPQNKEMLEEKWNRANNIFKKGWNKQFKGLSLSRLTYEYLEGEHYNTEELLLDDLANKTGNQIRYDLIRNRFQGFLDSYGNETFSYSYVANEDGNEVRKVVHNMNELFDAFENGDISFGTLTRIIEIFEKKNQAYLSKAGSD